MTKRQLKNIPLDMILEPERELRTVMTREKLEELAQSIKRFGVIEPIVVKRKGEKYEILAGHRRFLASQIAGLVDIPAIIQDCSDEDSEAITLEENIQREDVNAMDIARYLAYLYEQRKLSVTEIAERFNKTPQWVNSHLRLLGMDEMLQAAVEAGQMPYASALELMKIDDQAHRETLARAAIENGASHRTIRNWVIAYQNEKHFREKVASGEYSTPSTIPQNPLTFECFCCKNRHDQNSAITVRLCPDCFDVVKDFTEIYRRENKGGEANDQTTS